MILQKIQSDCAFVMTGEIVHLQRVQELMKYFVTLIEPKNLDGNSPENYLIVQRKNFEEVCFYLRREGNVDPEQMTVLAFHVTIETLEEENRKKLEASTNQ